MSGGAEGGHWGQAAVVVGVVLVGHGGVGKAVGGRGAVEGEAVGRRGRGEEAGGGLVLQAGVVLEGVLEVADVVDDVLDEFEARHLPIFGDVRYDLSQLVQVEAHLGLHLSAAGVAVWAAASLAEASTSSTAAAATASTHGTHIVTSRTHHRVGCVFRLLLQPSESF